MRAQRWWRVLAVCSVVALVAAGCGDDDGDDDDTTDPTDPPAGGGALVFGALLPESGSLSAIVDALRTPIDMAVEEINDAGGVLGQDATIAAADDGSDDGNQAATGFDRLVNTDGITVLLGPASSPLAEGLMDQIADSSIVACGGSNTAGTIADLDDGGRYFGFAPDDSLQGPALAEVIAADEHGSVAILTRNDTYGTGFGSFLESALVDAGIDIPLNEAYDPAADSFSGPVQSIIDSGADAAVVLGYNDDTALVISDMIEAGIGPGDFPVYGGDGSKGSSFYESVDADDPSSVEGFGGTAPAAAPAGVEHPFQAAYAETGLDTIFSAYYYDCTIATALATEAAGTTDADAVAAEMLEVTSGGTACNTFADCKALLEDDEDIDYNGASGPLDLDEGGHVTSGAYDVWEYDAEGVDTTLDEPQIVIGR